MTTLRLTNLNPFAGLESIVTENEPLAPHTWYRIGGPARWFVRPQNVEQLQLASQRCIEHGLPIFVLGLGANLLVSDAGVGGAVFRLDEQSWLNVQIDGTSVHVGAGADMQKLVVKSCRAGLTGLECMAGIPGTVGGGVRMNAGGKFGDIGSVVRTVTVMDPQGTVFDRTKDDLIFEYRKTNIVAPFILGATLELEADDPDQIAHRTKEIWMYKRNSQPLNAKSAGCIFKNPPGASAGSLIDQSGMKGMSVGGARVSEKHANFFVASPGCKADDVLKLVKLVQEKVHQTHGVELETEVRIWQ